MRLQPQPRGADLRSRKLATVTAKLRFGSVLFTSTESLGTIRDREPRAPSPLLSHGSSALRFRLNLRGLMSLPAEAKTFLSVKPARKKKKAY